MGSLTFLFLLVSGSAYAQLDGDYRTKANGNYGDYTIWERFDGGTNTWVAANPIQFDFEVNNYVGWPFFTYFTWNNITINHHVKMGAPDSRVSSGFVTIGTTGELEIEQGVFNYRTFVFNIWDVYGKITVSNTGTFYPLSTNGFIFFNAGSVYTHDIDGDVIPDADYWDVTSTCLVKGVQGSMVGNLTQTFSYFGNFIYDCKNQNTNLSFNEELTDIQGTFQVLSTNGFDLTLADNGSLNMNIGGGLYIQGAATDVTNLYLAKGMGTNTLVTVGDFLAFNGPGATLTTGTGSTGIISLKGDLLHNNQSTITTEGTGAMEIGFTGSSVAQTWQSDGNLVTNNVSFRVNNANGVDLIGYNAGVPGAQLIFNNGHLRLNGQHLVLGLTTIVGGTPGAASCVVTNSTGELRKLVDFANDSFTFPLGDDVGTSEYSPASITITDWGWGAPPTFIGFQVKNVKHADEYSPHNYLNRYWTQNTDAFGFEMDITLNYTNADVTGIESEIHAKKKQVIVVGPSWERQNWPFGISMANTITNTLFYQSTNIPGKIDLTGGQRVVFLAQQNVTSPICKNSTEEFELMRMTLITTDYFVTISDLELTTTGCTNPTNDLASLKLYISNYDIFSPSYSAASTVLNPNGTVNFAPSNILYSASTYYLFVSGKLKPSATINNFVDLTAEQITLSIGVTETPLTNIIPGNRKIESGGTPLAGTYQVGSSISGTDYLTLSEALEDLKCKGISAAVVFELVDSDYNDINIGGNEVMPYVISEITGASATNTVTIKPAANVTSTIRGYIDGTYSNAVFLFNGCDYITIDGSNNGTNSRNLMIVNDLGGNTPLTPTAVIHNRSLGAGEGATNNTIRNCKIKGGNGFYDVPNFGTMAMGVYSGGESIYYYLSGLTGTEGADNHNFTLHNNEIYDGAVAVAICSPASNPSQNVVFTNNIIGGKVDDFENSNLCGLYVCGVDNLTVQNNSIFKVKGIGINVFYNFNDGMDYAAPLRGMHFHKDITNATVSHNIVHDISYVLTNGFGARGIDFEGENSSGVLIRNNAISNVLADGSETGEGYPGTSTPPNCFVYGLYVNKAADVEIVNNTVHLSGNREPNEWLFPVENPVLAAFGYGALASNLTVRNNVFSNTITCNDCIADSLPAGIHYAVHGFSEDGAATATALTDCNYNLYYVSSDDAYTALANIDALDVPDLQSMQFTTSQDGSSISADVTPAFTSVPSLLPDNGVSESWYLSGTGAHNANVTDDLEQTPRPANVAAGAPDLGAYEFSYGASPVAPPLANIITVGNTDEIWVAQRKIGKIEWQGAHPGMSVSARYYSGYWPYDPTNNGQVTANYFNCFLRISHASTAPYNFTHYYDDALIGGVIEPVTHAAKKQTGVDGTWTYDIPDVLNTSLNFYTRNGYTGFSDFTGSDEPVPLAAELLSLSGKVQKEGNYLSWNGNINEQTSSFILERSSDLRQWQSILQSTKATDSQIDTQPLERSYYRVRAINAEGHSRFSNIIELNRTQGLEPSLILYPNPASATQPMMLTISTAKEEQVLIRMLDAIGRSVYETQMQLNAGGHAIELPIANLPAGVYTISVQTSMRQYALKAVITR